LCSQKKDYHFGDYKLVIKKFGGCILTTGICKKFSGCSNFLKACELSGSGQPTTLLPGFAFINGAFQKGITQKSQVEFDL
jgi:hypothetical protein